MLKGASRVQIPPSPCGESTRPCSRPRGRIERRALRRRLRRLDPDVEIVVVERELAGGECSYYACIPTKTLLRPGEVLAAARLAPGAAEAITGELDAERVFWWRDQVTDGRDDSWHAELARRTGRRARSRRRAGAQQGRRRRRRAGDRVRVPRGGDGLVAGGAARRRPGRGRVLDEPRGRLGERRTAEPRRPRRRARSARSSPSSSVGSAPG